MKCNISKKSELVEFANDSQHKYIRGVFTECEDSKVGRTRLAQWTTRNRGEYVVNIYPARNADGSIDEQSQEELEAVYNDLLDGKLDKEVFLVGRHKVEVPEFVMFDNNGNVRMQGNNPRVWDYINITTFNVIENGVEISICDDNELQSRANAIRRYRIDNGDWMDADDYFGNGDSNDEEPNDDGVDPTVNAAPKQDEQRQSAIPSQPARPQRRRLTNKRSYLIYGRSSFITQKTLRSKPDNHKQANLK